VGQQGPLQMVTLWRAIFSELHTMNLTTEELFRVLVLVMKNTFLILSPILLSIMCAGVISNIIQTRGLKISSHPLIPKFNKLNPLKGIGRIFSKNSLNELFKSIFKITIISIISYQTIKGRWDEIPPLMGFDVGQIMIFMGQVSLEIMFKVLVVMIFLAAIDYMFQRYTYMENLRMTKQQVKDEHKDQEGDDYLKGKIRERQRAVSERSLRHAVSESAVVITNPTHYAVALQYDMDTMPAPILIAKGVDELALRIREKGDELDIPIVENPPLARALYAAVDLDEEIPAEHYNAVAEIIGYVYRLKGRMPTVNQVPEPAQPATQPDPGPGLKPDLGQSAGPPMNEN